MSEISLTRFTNLVLMLNNNHQSSICRNMPRKLVPRDRRGIRDHIGHLISVRDVPALGTSLLVVYPNLQAQRRGAFQRPGVIFPNQQTCNSRSFQYCKLDANRTLLDGRELTLFGVVFWLQNIIRRPHQMAWGYDSIEELSTIRWAACWFLHCIDNSVSSSNIIDGGSQSIEKQWEHHIKTNGSKSHGCIQWTSRVFMSYACSFFSEEMSQIGVWSCKVYWFRIPLLLSLQRCMLALPTRMR